MFTLFLLCFAFVSSNNHVVNPKIIIMRFGRDAFLMPSNFSFSLKRYSNWKIEQKRKAFYPSIVHTEKLFRFFILAYYNVVEIPMYPIQISWKGLLCYRENKAKVNAWGEMFPVDFTGAKWENNPLVHAWIHQNGPDELGQSQCQLMVLTCSGYAQNLFLFMIDYSEIFQG